MLIYKKTQFQWNNFDKPRNEDAVTNTMITIKNPYMSEKIQFYVAEINCRIAKASCLF